MYAKHHNVPIWDVTKEVLEASDLGMEGWACYGIDCKARGPMGNAMYRQIKKDPKANDTYKWLFEDLKKKFRQTWAVHRSFDFISTKRVYTISSKTKQEEIGSYKSQLQLEVYFGGAGHPEAVRQAKNYIANCRKFQAWPLRHPNHFSIDCLNLELVVLCGNSRIVFDIFGLTFPISNRRPLFWTTLGLKLRIFFWWKS